MEVRIKGVWREKLKRELEKSYGKKLIDFVKKEYAEGTVYPKAENIFRAFELTPFEDVRVVILGQDPYHGAGQAVGLSFAIEEGITLPPSLRNIYKEVESDFGSSISNRNGDLSRWAQQGVLLLNATLTVRAGSPGSHQKKGWEEFTDAVIKTLSDEREHIVFILWGNYARTKGTHIDRSKHLVIESPHPSPFSARTGFFGSKPFSKANAYLQSNNEKPINWL